MSINNQKYYDFRNQFMNKTVDIDGYYGCQCWDGYAKYCKYLGLPFAHCSSTGYVQDIWTNRKSNGMLNNFIEVNYMQPGDIAVFKKSSSTPYSHIAIYDSNIDGTYGRFFGTNQGGKKGAFNIITLPYSATFDTAFRPKQFITNSNQSTQTGDGNIDQILHVKSFVTSKQMTIKAGIKTINGDQCVNIPELGGYFPCRMISKVPNSDGYSDNVLHTDKALVTVDRIQVTSVNVKNNTVRIGGIWVNAGPLIEVV